MYYSKILTELTKQEKNPVNKMYLSELSLKWKAFQQLTEKPFINSDLADGISQYLSSLHNRKFMFSKIRGTGFFHNSKIFSANYLYDIVDALIKKQPIIHSAGIKWDFQSVNFGFEMENTCINDFVTKPKFNGFFTSPVLSLCLDLDYQFRIKGKKYFTKQTYNFPILLFYAYKTLNKEHLLDLIHVSKSIQSTCRYAKIFIVCESIADDLEALIQRLPIQVFVLIMSTSFNKKNISVEMINKLEEHIIEILEKSPSVHLMKDKKLAAKNTGSKSSRSKTKKDHKKKK